MTDFYSHLKPEQRARIEKITRRIKRLERILEHHGAPRMQPGAHHYFEVDPAKPLCIFPFGTKEETKQKLFRLAELHNRLLGEWQNLTGCHIN